MAMRTRDRSSTSRDRDGTSLVDWGDPERNARALDWRERAHMFGLVPVERRGPVEHVIEPPERLLFEEDPEAFEEQPLGEAEWEALEPEEIEEAPEARLPQEARGLVRVYLTHIGRRKLLTTLLRPPVIVGPEDALLSVLRLLQTRRSHMGIVVDRGGAPVGIVTLEDIVEEVLGDLYDEDDDRAVQRLFAARGKLKDVVMQGR
jgi:CBS domain-containing protein